MHAKERATTWRPKRVFGYTSVPMTHRLDADVAVVGAGPAGARTAEVLALRGHSVIMLDRGLEPGQPIHCTGIVSHECVERYDLPEALALHEVRSFILHSPKGREAQVRRKTVQAYVLDRLQLDRHLVGRAQSAGAELRSSAAVDDLVWNGIHVDVRATIDGERADLAVRAVVLATGYGAPLARRLGLGHVGGVISGCQALVEAPGTDQVEVFTGGTHGRGGFGWLVPHRPGYALAGVLTRAHTYRHMQSHIERLQAAGRIGEVQEVYRCRPIPLGVGERSVLDGIVGVGDVVNQVKPTTGGGIYYGLLGADAAAETLAAALEAGDVSASALEPYENRWRELMASEITRGYQLRRVIEQLPDAVVEQMHRLLRVPGLRRLLTSAAMPFDWHSGPLLRFVDRLSRLAVR